MVDKRVDGEATGGRHADDDDRAVADIGGRSREIGLGLAALGEMARQAHAETGPAGRERERQGDGGHDTAHQVNGDAGGDGAERQDDQREFRALRQQE